MAKTTPTQRTLKQYRDAGYRAEVVEHWNAFARQRKDLFGFIDIVAISEEGTIGVQCTSKSNMSARVKKILEECTSDALLWLKAGNRIDVVGWAKDKKTGRWKSATRPVQKEDFK